MLVYFDIHASTCLGFSNPTDFSLAFVFLIPRRLTFLVGWSTLQRASSVWRLQGSRQEDEIVALKALIVMGNTPQLDAAFPLKS